MALGGGAIAIRLRRNGTKKKGLALALTLQRREPSKFALQTRDSCALA